MLSTHSHLNLTGEVHWIPDILNAGRKFQHFFENPCCTNGALSSESKWRKGIHALHAAIFSDKINCKWGFQIIGDNNAIVAEEILELFPEAKIIFLTRDPRDLFVSQIRTGIGSRFSGQTLIKFLNAINRAPNQHITIRYEDLVTWPRKECEKICTLLDIKFESEMLFPFSQQISRNEIPALKDTTDQNSLGNPVNVQRWKKQLLNEELLLMNSETDTIENLGYPILRLNQVRLTGLIKSPVSGSMIGMCDSKTGLTTFDGCLPSHVDIKSAGVVCLHFSSSVEDLKIHLEGIGELLPHSFSNRLYCNQVQTFKERQASLSRHVALHSLPRILAKKMGRQKLRKIFIYSAGRASELLLQSPFIDNLQILGIIDSYKTGEFIVGNRTYPVIPLQNAIQQDFDAIFVTSISFFHEIKENLLRQGLKEGEKFYNIVC